MHMRRIKSMSETLLHQNDLDASAIANNDETVGNIRINDYEPVEKSIIKLRASGSTISLMILT